VKFLGVNIAGAAAGDYGACVIECRDGNPYYSFRIPSLHIFLMLLYEVCESNSYPIS
jgi:hypothetical protein